MLTPDLIFKITSGIAAVGWVVILFASPFWKQYDKFVMGVVISLLALTYSFINFTNFDTGMLVKFSTLDGVGQLFQNRNLLVGAWLHIMAFDLLCAVWIKNNSVRNHISHLAIIPALIFSCLFGPFGYLIYLITRFIKTKKYFGENFISF